jgi:hypothetical protein
MMNDQQKLAFVHKMSKLALQHLSAPVQHLDQGGMILPTASIGSSANGISATGQMVGTQNGLNPSSQGIGGAVNSVLGTSNNYQPTGATITPGTNAGQLNTAYTNAQTGLNSATGLANNAVEGGNQGLASQQFLTGQLTNEALGNGPNPAQAALNQNTGNNIASQAALMAGQRGASANAGLLARQAGQQGAAIQQNAVGQAATLQAQQQLAAQNALQGLAGTQVGQTQNAVQLQNQVAQNEQNILQGANTSANNAAVSMQGNINNNNAAIATGNQAANANTVAGIGGAIGSVVGGIASLFAKGGVVGKPSMPLPKHLHSMAKIFHPHYAEGGMAWQPSVPVVSPIMDLGGAKTAEQPLKQLSVPNLSFGSGDEGEDEESMGPQTLAGGPQDAGGITAPAVGLGVAAPETMLAARGGKVESKLKAGGKVPGKPKVGHDDYDNDVVDAKLSPGEVVIDLNTLKDKGKLGQMARFVAANIERKKAGRKA